MSLELMMGFVRSAACARALLFLTATFVTTCHSLTPNGSSLAHLVSTDAPPLLDVPTYSLATKNDDDNGGTNMNILTYATPVSVRPDRTWCLGLYKDTLSTDNFLRTRTCVLQLLTERHAGIVATLGGSSGRDADKAGFCAESGLPWQTLDLEGEEEPSDDASSSKIQVLPGCVHYLQLTAVGDIIDAGSHLIAPCCKVKRMWVDESNDDGLLLTSKLRELGIINEQGRVAD